MKVDAPFQTLPLKRLISSIASGVSVNATDTPAEQGQVGVLKTSCVYSGTFDASENKTVVPEDLSRVACAVKADTLIVSRMNTPDLVGAAGLAASDEPDIYLPDRLWQVSFDRSAASPRFVYWWTRSTLYRDQVKVACAGTSSSMQNLDQDSFRTFVVPHLSLPRQESVANFLDEQTARIDALIAEKVRLRDALSEQANALVYALVTRGLKAPSMSPTHVSWLREVPSHWSVARIKHVARLESGHTPDKKVDAYWQDCDIPWVSLNDTGRLLEVDYITETSFNVNQLGIDNSSARLLPAGTVFFSRDATIGRCGIAARPMACSQHFIGWVCGARLYPEYLLFALRSMAGELERVTMGATLKTIGMDDVKALSIPLPPMAEQRAIVDEAKLKRQHLKDLSQHTTAFVDSLREYRSSLVSAAVTGQLDISTFKAAA